jgi:nicotinamidase-related amidase
MNVVKTVARLVRQDAALLVVDVQEKLLPSIFEEERVRRNTVTMVRAAQILGVPMLVTEQYPKGIGRTAPDVAEALGAAAAIEKLTFSTFGELAFVEALGALERRTLIVVGIEAHVCVTQSVLDALSAGYEVHVLADAVSSRTESNWRSGLNRMQQAGAVVSSTEMALFELLHVAGTPEFKEVLRLIK